MDEGIFSESLSFLVEASQANGMAQQSLYYIIAWFGASDLDRDMIFGDQKRGANRNLISSGTLTNKIVFLSINLRILIIAILILYTERALKRILKFEVGIPIVCTR